MSLEEPTVRIKNLKRYQGSGFYIGRPSALGNPFAIGRDGGREEVIAKYKVWLDERLGFDCPATRMFVGMFDSLEKSGELTITCWCAPKRCHGEVIRDLLLQAWREAHGF